MTIDPTDIKVKIKLLTHDKILAQATLVLGDIWEIHAWKILKSNQPHKLFGEYVWIQSPSFKYGSKWKEIVFINNEPMFRMVEKQIYDSYKRELEREEALKNDFTELTEEDEKNIESMPF